MSGLRARARAMPLCLVLLGTTGCLLGRSRVPDRYFRLAAPAPGAEVARGRLAGVLLVDAFSASGPVATRSMLYVDAATPNELHRRTNRFWAEPPARMLRDIVATYLAQARAADVVVTPEQRLTPDHIVSGHVRVFEERLGEAAPRAVVEVDLGLVHGSARSPVTLNRYREESPLKPAGARADPVVAAFERAVAEVCRRFVVDLTEADRRPKGGAPMRKPLRGR